MTKMCLNVWQRLTREKPGMEQKTVKSDKQLRSQFGKREDMQNDNKQVKRQLRSVERFEICTFMYVYLYTCMYIYYGNRYLLEEEFSVDSFMWFS